MTNFILLGIVQIAICNSLAVFEAVRVSTLFEPRNEKNIIIIS